MKPRPFCLAPMVLLLGACNGDIYLWDGVTNGDTFYLAERALHDPDPVLQSWVSYSLSRSACQLQLDDENPARATSFECELTAREHLLETWSGHRNGEPGTTNRYLDDLLSVRAAGHLDEYVWHYLREASWSRPPDLDAKPFRAWRERNLPRHSPETRLIGSWNYR